MIQNKKEYNPNTMLTPAGTIDDDYYYQRGKSMVYRDLADLLYAAFKQARQSKGAIEIGRAQSA